MGLVVLVIVSEGVVSAVGSWGVIDGVGSGNCWEGDDPNDLAVVLRPSGTRDPSEWSVSLGFHLSGPLSRWKEQALTFSGVSWRHPPLGPSASGSPGSLPRLSARRTRSSNTPRTTHVTGGRRLTAYTWPQGVPTSGSREKETGEFSGVPFGFRTLSSGVAAAKRPGPRGTGVVHS